MYFTSIISLAFIIVTSLIVGRAKRVNSRTGYIFVVIASVLTYVLPVIISVMMGFDFNNDNEGAIQVGIGFAWTVFSVFFFFWGIIKFFKVGTKKNKAQVSDNAYSKNQDKMEGKKFCSSCGSSITNLAKFCTGCGSKVVNESLLKQ